MKTECDYLCGWMKKRSHMQKNSPKMVNPRGIAGNADDDDTTDLKAGILAATLSGAWHCGFCARTGWPGVSTRWLGEIASWPAATVSVWQHVKLSEQIRTRDALCMSLECLATNKQHRQSLASDHLSALLAVPPLFWSRYRGFYSYSALLGCFPGCDGMHVCLD